ncbi:MAG: 5-formyltetrahydrofolate cyclo-ligase [Leucothrix sp.]
MIDQSTIRKRIQTERQQLKKDQQALFSQAICQQIIDSGVLNNANNIAFYLPVRGEADPTYLQQAESLLDKQFYLPVLSSTHQNHLVFALYNEQTPMKFNRFNIPEPDTDTATLLTDPQQLDAVIMPMVAIDRAGNRIGMGGGFYDRTFAFRKTKQCQPQLIAFAYDLQLIEEQTPQAWDVPTDAIALQTEFIQL